MSPAFLSDAISPSYFILVSEVKEKHQTIKEWRRIIVSAEVNRKWFFHSVGFCWITQPGSLWNPNWWDFLCYFFLLLRVAPCTSILCTSSFPSACSANLIHPAFHPGFQFFFFFLNMIHHSTGSLTQENRAGQKKLLENKPICMLQELMTFID